ncbi:uncharacterized protein LOC107305012 [Oryza brachyantha]|uniref:Uncharacterized protein n=1 Tax=Oryza brachyantha TaxID=4533 RepID=J3L1Z8_ORYBR|nr:uncharacterized protein LOC107305012 [Oryza brachyantha]
MLASKMHQTQEGVERRGGMGEDGKEMWDMGSSLYDSYELASLCQILDRHVGTGDLPLLHGEPRQEGQRIGTGAPPPPKERRNAQAVVPRGAAQRGGGTGRKVTLRALFRAAASWAAVTRPRKAHGGACVGADSAGAIEPVVSPGR